MEFILHFPQDIDKNGSLWQIWSNFCHNMKFFQIAELEGTTQLNSTSLLLFAAHEQINSICSSLKMYNIDLPQLNQILQVVEQACLPYFILLFERFKYFSLKHEPSDSLDEFAVILRKQIEYCEFGNLKDSMMTNAIDSSLKSESLVEHLSNTDGLLFDYININYNDEQKSQTSAKDTPSNDDKNSLHLDKTRLQNGQEALIQSSDAHFSDDADISYNDIAEDDEVTLFFKKNTKPRRSHRVRGRKLSNFKAQNKNNNRGKLLCCFCDRSFVGQICFKKHLLVKHKGSTRFKCKSCKDDFLNVDDYMSHYENEHFMGQHKPSIKTKVKRNTGKCNCSVCGGSLVKEGCLKLHMNESLAQSFLCWGCGLNFSNLLDYKQHCQKHSANVRFSCDLCQRQHKNIFRLHLHLKNHMMPQNKCELCGVIFIKAESLARHILRHTSTPDHVCEICGKNFTKDGRLRAHMRTHSGEKKFTCELCGKTYAHRNNLVHHKRWHAGELPYECEICGKRTRSSGDLSKHKRKHSDKHPYVCEVCGKGFNYSHTLSRHRLGHTGKRSYGCEVCGRTFIYNEGLRDHIKAQRCPGRRTESGFKRTPKATKLMKTGMPANIDVIETEVYVPTHSQRSTDTGLKDTQDWLYVLRNNETEVATSVLVVSSLY